MVAKRVLSRHRETVQTFQVLRFQHVLERRLATPFGADTKLLDHALFSLYRSCSEAGVRDVADQLLACYRQVEDRSNDSLTTA